MYEITNIGVLSQFNALWSGLTCYTRFQTTGATFTSDIGGYTFTPNNTGVFTYSGKTGNAIYSPFQDHSTNYSVNSGSNIGITSLPVSVSFWLKVADNWASGNYFALFSWSNGATALGFNGYVQYRSSTHKIALYTGDGGTIDLSTIRVYEFPFTLTKNNWFHIVGTATAYNNVKCYINGVDTTSDYTEGSGTSVSWTNATFSFLKRSTAYDNNYQIIDQFGCWNRILSQAEINLLYSSGNGYFY